MNMPDFLRDLDMSFASPDWVSNGTNKDRFNLYLSFYLIAVVILVYVSLEYKKKWIMFLSYLLPILAKITVIKEPVDSPAGFVVFIGHFVLVGITHFCSCVVLGIKKGQGKLMCLGSLVSFV